MDQQSAHAGQLGEDPDSQTLQVLGLETGASSLSLVGSCVFPLFHSPEVTSLPGHSPSLPLPL